MKTSVFALSLLWPSFAGAYEFQAPVQLKGGDQPIKTQSPGYAAPCLHDLDGDGEKELLVGQFANGCIHTFKGLGDGKFAQGKLLEVDGRPVKIPGVW
ncbi:hypothetical protein OAF84_02680 [Akkermansiaceae bacterium]|nr:hypothetical protein [Verrucomicrobiaceae bacterium]MDA7615085.1 hypothetical protein [Akkermansiaceae bacterium]MDB4727052.1 hypothetical protein [bacterium]MDB2429530.1 hypothetical protein [Akkermansiaceae bacterium]MDB4576982.1 hypothetical protein [Akkermansiaceae bacterium]